MSGIERRNEGVTMEGQDMENMVEVTDLADVRPGDMVTVSYEGHEATGEAWETAAGDLWLGSSVIRWGNGEADDWSRFVRAVRKVEPLKPGIYVEAGHHAIYNQARACVSASGEVQSVDGFELGETRAQIRDLIYAGLVDGSWIHCGEPSDD